MRRADAGNPEYREACCNTELVIDTDKVALDETGWKNVCVVFGGV
jgi:hypothetical protein